MKRSYEFVEINKKYGKLTVVDIFYTNKKRMVKCICDCGKERIGRPYILKNSSLASCGCETLKRYQKANRNDPGECSYNFYYNNIKSGARTRKYEFNLSFLDFKEITNRSCYYCGLPPQPYNYYLKKDKQIKKTKFKVYQDTIDRSWIAINGIDRVDNNKGYSVENCVSCCAQCNTSKLNYSYDEFISWIKRAAKHQGFNND